MTPEDNATTIARLEEDNRRLRSLLETNGAPEELRHRLRNTVALLRAIVRRSAETKRDVDDYVAHLEDRMDALSRAQAAADARGSIDLHATIADELLRYDAKEGGKLQLSGPAVNFQPRAGQLMALAIHELAVNAVEHGSLTTPKARIRIAWHHEPDKVDTPLTLVWKESGHTSAVDSSRGGFGTELLTRTLQYELAAQTRLEFEADGLRYTLCFPMTERIGRIEEWIDEAKPMWLARSRTG